MNSARLGQLLDKQKYLLVFSGILVIYAFNLFIDIMDVDAAQYASISMEMWQDKNFLHVYHRNMDYLDKPPLLFWLSSLSMGIFGINNFAYKFPSFLLALLGIYSTFHFARLYYSKKVASFAALILASTEALFLITNDVRTDTNLLAFVIFSVWQLATFIQTNKWKHLLLGFVGVGFAMMAKGPIGIVAVVAALGSDFLLKRQWKNIFNWKWLIGLILVGIMLAPLTYGLYTQFDLHPEKEAYDIKSPSGVKFFYWTQSFGRITGDSAWRDDTSPFFFVHSILWDFQPWILYLVLSLGVTVRSIFSGRFFKDHPEFMTIGGFVLVFFAMSLSNYKLPHYIFVAFPFAAILAARYLANLETGKKWLVGIQIFFNALFWIIIGVGLSILFPPKTIILPIILVPICVISWTYFFTQKKLSNRLFFGTITTIIGFNLMLATNFYPQLVSDYQAGGNIGRMVHKKELAPDAFHWYKAHDHSLDFYSQRILPEVFEWNLPGLPSGHWVYTNQSGYDRITQPDMPYRLIGSFDDYPVTQLKLPFLYKKTRPETLEKVYLFERE